MLYVVQGASVAKLPREYAGKRGWRHFLFFSFHARPSPPPPGSAKPTALFWGVVNAFIIKTAKGHTGASKSCHLSCTRWTCSGRKTRAQTPQSGLQWGSPTEPIAARPSPVPSPRQHRHPLCGWLKLRPTPRYATCTCTCVDLRGVDLHMLRPTRRRPPSTHGHAHSTRRSFSQDGAQFVQERLRFGQRAPRRV